MKAGFGAIETHAEFQEKHGAQFTELKNFCNQLSAIEYRLDGAESCRTLLENYRSVSASHAFTDKGNWKTLQNLKAQATVELTGLLDRWRSEVRDQLNSALGRLPRELAQQNLDGDLATELGKPLIAIRDGLDLETNPVTVSNLPSRAAEEVRRLGERIQREIAKKAVPPTPLPPAGGIEPQPPSGEPPPPQPPTGAGPQPRASKPVRRLRVQDVAFVTVVHDVKDWDHLRDRLDERVRELIRQGYDVDLG